MRHFLLAFALLAVPCGLPAARAVADAAQFEKWIDPGWKLVALARGDLDGDGRGDAALVVEKDDPANRRRNEGPGATALNLNPRRLLILFAGDAGCAPAARIDRFLPSEHSADAPCLADPLEEGGVGISKQVLTIELHHWLSCGGWGVSHAAWRFRLEAGRFRLIGLDRSEFMRNSGARSESSTNFLTGRRKVVKGLNEFDDERARPSVAWQTLAVRRPLFLDAMTSECRADEGSRKGCD